jgi:hypothetical protein
MRRAGLAPGLRYLAMNWPRSRSSRCWSDLVGAQHHLQQGVAGPQRVAAVHRAESSSPSRPSASTRSPHSGRCGTGIRASPDLPNRFRRPYGPGWALIGDAGLALGRLRRAAPQPAAVEP